MRDLELERKSWDLRRNVVDIIMAGGGGHIGGDMSVLNTLLVLYQKYLRVNPQAADDPGRDRFVLSKGHAVEAYYAVLAEMGFLDLEDVKAHVSKFGSPYIGHPNNKLPGIEMNTGSLGHGLPVCVGMALAGKRDGRGYRVYTVLGDGELAEGSVWESAMAAGSFALDNLCAVVDRNGLQISGGTEDVMRQESLATRWSAFGWNVVEVDGDSIGALDEAFATAGRCMGRPTVLLARTTKGYGSPLMENKASWHHHLPTQEEYRQIIADFAARKETLEYE